MIEKLGKGFMTKKKGWTKSLKKSDRNNKRKYDFLVKSSTKFQEFIFKLCKRIIEQETIPEIFRNITLHQMWKKKPGARKEDLDANHFIHLHKLLPRVVEIMVGYSGSKGNMSCTGTYEM